MQSCLAFKSYAVEEAVTYIVAWILTGGGLTEHQCSLRAAGQPSKGAANLLWGFCLLCQTEGGLSDRTSHQLGHLL
jgi:hypothetical protein